MAERLRGAECERLQESAKLSLTVSVREINRQASGGQSRVLYRM